MNYDFFLAKNKAFTAVAFYENEDRKAVIVGSSFPKIEFLGLVKFTNEKAKAKITFSNFVSIKEGKEPSWPEIYENLTEKLEGFEYKLVGELEIPDEVLEELSRNMKKIVNDLKFDGKESLVKILSEPELEFEI